MCFYDISWALKRIIQFKSKLDILNPLLKSLNNGISCSRELRSINQNISTCDTYTLIRLEKLESQARIKVVGQFLIYLQGCLDLCKPHQ